MHSPSKPSPKPQPRPPATAPKRNPRPPEHINNAHENPLKDFLLLALAAVVALTLAAWALASSASWLAPLIPYEWEIALQAQSDSHQAAAEKQSQNQSEQKQQRALTALLADLIGPDALPTQVHYLADESMPNAFATLGGHIFVTRGLLENIESENGLAMVLAHEYAHIELRHPLILMLEQLSFSLLFSLIGSDNMAALISQNTSMLTILSFSRDMERDADHFSLERLQSYYGHSHGADEFFHNMQKLAAETALVDLPLQEFFQTHPLTDERLAHIQASQQSEGSPTLTPLPKALQLTTP